MVGPQGSDIHGLQSTDSAVILDLDTGKKAHCISDRKGVQPLKFLSAKGLRGYSLPVSEAGSISQYHRTVQLAVQCQTIGRLSIRISADGKNRQCHDNDILKDFHPAN